MLLHRQLPMPDRPSRRPAPSDRDVAVERREQIRAQLGDAVSEQLMSGDKADGRVPRV